MARGGMGNIQQLMQQAQRMQQQMAQKQAELAEKTVTAQSGGGMVTATVNGAHELLELSIDPDVIDPEDKEMLEDMVVAAVNQAMQQAEEMAQQELGKLTGGMNIPGLR
ncbi:MAG: YbaB/EbfC family nucleoid-associated protein [Christensenellales bacterium]|nr:YbaB/EbfC family nucleoid-associated protein [Clostridiales bacterium]